MLSGSLPLFAWSTGADALQCWCCSSEARLPRSGAFCLSMSQGMRPHECDCCSCAYLLYLWPQLPRMMYSKCNTMMRCGL
jgi:hypothetical protein